MADIIAFKGIRYDKAVAGDISKLVAPPYDVISPEYREALYDRSHHNVVRLDFAKPFPNDDETDNRYTRAKRCLDQWLGEGVLKVEEKPSLYVYNIDYTTPSGEAKGMSGFVCMLKLEDWANGVVLPHEGTLKGPKADRFELMKAAGASASQIFSLYSDPERTISRQLSTATKDAQPDISVKDDDGSHHRMWVVQDASAIEAVRAAMQGRKVFIADGHHRYETALAFRDYCKGMGMTTGEFEYVPMFLSNMDEDGLTVLPTHRLIKDAHGLSLEDILGKARQYFRIEEYPFTGNDEASKTAAFLNALVEKGGADHAFGFYFDHGSSFHLLTLKEMDPVIDTFRCSRSETYCRLDVTILHTLIIERVLGIDTEAVSNDQPVKFEKDGVKALERVASGEFAMCFLLNPTKVREVKDVALAGEIMPQKSTYFYPKLLTGLVIARIAQ